MSAPSTPILSRYRPDLAKSKSFDGYSVLTEITNEDCIKGFKGSSEKRALQMLSYVSYPLQVLGVHWPEWDETDTIHSSVSLLHFAAERGWKDACRTLILNHDFPSDIQDNGGYSPLHYAVGGGCLETAKLLVYFRCPVHAKKPVSLIQLACGEGAMDVVEYLTTECRCSLDVCDSNYNTPLHSAARRGHVKMVDYLMSSGKIDPMLRNVEGDTALHTACRSGKVSVVLCLINSNLIDINSHNSIGDTPLHIACKYKYPTIVKHLLRCRESSIKVNHRNTLGNTPLHIVCQLGHAEIVDMLLASASIDLSCENDNGDTPLHLACKEGHLLAIESVLNQTGTEALTNHPNKQGRTPLQGCITNL